MGKIESTIKEEIMRLAKKEIKVFFSPLASEVRAMKKKLSSLSKTVSSLDRWTREKIRQDEKDKLMLKANAGEIKKSRFTPQRIRNLRQKLGLSQKALAILTEVTIGTVGAWEKGKFGPRADKKAALIALRKLGKREARKVMDKKRAELVKKKTVRGKIRKGKGKGRAEKKRSGRTAGRKH